MTALMWQTALLLLGAYFLGAWVACMARRFFFAAAEEPVVIQTAAPATAPEPVPVTVQARPPPAPRPVPVAPEVKPVVPIAPAAARETASETVARFGEALSGTGNPPPRPAAAGAAAPRQGAMNLPTPPDRSTSGVTSMVEANRSRTPDVAEAAGGSALAAAAAAVSRASVPPPGSAGSGVLPAAAGSTGRASVAAPVVSPPVVLAPVAAAEGGDDLTLIQGVDDAIQARLNKAGVRRFAEIAAWKPDQVAAIAAALEMPGRIERENWIEQAHILAKGGDTKYSSRRKSGETASAEPMADEGVRRSIVPEAVAAAVPSGAAAAAAAAAAAVSRVAAMAAPAAGAGSADSAAVRALRPAGPVRDNLQRIGGINGEVERMLNVQGVSRYNQIASWSPDDIAKFDRLLGSGGRIGRENWIEQAKVLDRGDETAYSRQFDRRSQGEARPSSLAAAIAARAAGPAPAAAEAATSPGSNIAMLRSVKSEAFRSADAPAAGGFDDLKRIRGVGVLIEKKLNSLGISRYEQIAGWSNADIERFSDKLDFKGRIERENWVEQARILSTGGHTEFSKRVDRGEVESSKP